MKKLMAIAAIAVSGAAVAANCSPITPVIDTTPAVYNWKFTGKTTVGDYIKGYHKDGSGCAPSPIDVLGEAIRVPGSLAIQGYTYYCVPCCGTFAEAPDYEVFYFTKPYKDALIGGVNTSFVNVIGKKAKDVEVYGILDGVTTAATSAEAYSLTYAGFGKYDLKNFRVSSASGNFAGLKAMPHYLKVAGCPEAVYWDCTGSVYLSGNPAIAYGKWSVKYNSTASKKYGKNGIKVKVPAWAVTK